MRKPLILLSCLLVFSGCGGGEDSGSAENDASNAGEVGFVPSPERPDEFQQSWNQTEF